MRCPWAVGCSDAASGDAPLARSGDAGRKGAVRGDGADKDHVAHRQFFPWGLLDKDDGTHVDVWLHGAGEHRHRLHPQDLGDDQKRGHAGQQHNDNRGKDITNFFDHMFMQPLSYFVAP